MTQTELSTAPSSPRVFVRGLRNVFKRDIQWENVSFVCCVLFGIALLADTHPAGDGGWFWYASLLRGGKLLYADMHLALQPLFVLESSTFMALLGEGWLASKVPALLHLVAYCFGLLLLVRSSSLSHAHKAVVLACAFFVSILFEGYRFDDYHVLTDCFQLYSLVTLLALRNQPDVRLRLILSAALGALSGLAVTTRVNDGGALFVGVLFGILCLAPSRKLLSAGISCLALILTVVVVVKLTGDSLHDYASYSIFHAAGSKGGTGSVLLQPLYLPLNTIHWLRAHWHEGLLRYELLLGLTWALLLHPLIRRRGKQEFVLALIGLLFLAYRGPRMYHLIRGVDPVIQLSALMVLVAYGLGTWVFFNFVWSCFRSTEWNRRHILLLIPLGQLAAGSMSTAGTHLGLYGPVAVLIVLLSTAPPIHLRVVWLRDFFVALAVIAIYCIAPFKVGRPYSWHTYVEKPLFTGRTWYRHPVYGPMILDRDQLEMIKPVCQAIAGDELLSLPFSYANYFCSTPPWHGYVQTFFDTSSKELIQQLMDELEHSPPKWILEQRQPETLRLHEVVFNHGEPLQHRYLGELIQQKIDDGVWHVVYTSDFGSTPGATNKWVLIRTR